ncbi:MAG: carboxymuconolactone decarboxylase family protein [Flavipsychrobacter sp.]|nr:carboxymuconolactone decarboxylase family protein [Flavipsychrobacter sp.]
MTKRINIARTKPEAIKGLMMIGGYLAQGTLDKKLKELVKIRASQINGCAYCIDMHTQDARKLGETEKRIYLLNAWKETNLYSQEERAALQLTEEMTLIANGGVQDDTYQQAADLLGEEQYTELVMAIVAINAWNRLTITAHAELTYNAETGAW